MPTIKLLSKVCECCFLKENQFKNKNYFRIVLYLRKYSADVEPLVPAEKLST